MLDPGFFPLEKHTSGHASSPERMAKVARSKEGGLRSESSLTSWSPQNKRPIFPSFSHQKKAKVDKERLRIFDVFDHAIFLDIWFAYFLFSGFSNQLVFSWEKVIGGLA